MRRDKPKDAYDVVWLLDALGPDKPDKGAELVTSSPITTGHLAGDVHGQLHRLISDQFKDTSAAGPAMYADFLEANPGDLERRHAHGTLTALGQALTCCGIQLSRTLIAWLMLIALDGDLARAEPKTLRYKVFHVGGRPPPAIKINQVARLPPPPTTQHPRMIRASRKAM